MSSPSPPSSLNVGYSTYRSKRHSATPSANTIFQDHPNGVVDGVEGTTSTLPNGNYELSNGYSNSSTPFSTPSGYPSPGEDLTAQKQLPLLPAPVQVPPQLQADTLHKQQPAPILNGTNGSTSADTHEASSSAPPPPSRTASTFRRVPLKSSQPLTPSPLRPGGPSVHHRTLSNASLSSFRSSSSSQFVRPSNLSHPSTPTRIHSFATPSAPSPRVMSPSIPETQPLPAIQHPSPLSVSVAVHTLANQAPHPPPSSPSPSLPTPIIITPSASQAPPVPEKVNGNSRAPSRSSTPANPIAQSRSAPAPYRHGFQPKGVYSLRTDEFLELRSRKNDGRRTQDKRLERRLEKLIELHFSPEGTKPPPTRRSSSFLDFSDIKGKNAADLWKGVLESSQNKTERHVRDVEQSITHWEDDASVSACPICTQQFNALTNRKHHCRLCGRVVCSLPPRPPLRPRSCSLLIAADVKTGRIEEVPDLIAYGVMKRGDERPRGPSSGPNPKDKDMYLKGIRICRDCHAVVQRQQYLLESSVTPTYARLYNAMIRVEREIQESLPQFHEFMQTLTASNPKSSSTSHRAAIQARQNVLSAFAEYDAIAKRIRSLPCTSGSSQDRLQGSMATRANLFLQQHMFPLKSLQSFEKHSRASSQASNSTLDTLSNDPTTPNGLDTNTLFVDTDSELALTLQPLLEQEALLESFVEEAKAARKFEDAKTLKVNLDEIRVEIERIAKGGKLR